MEGQNISENLKIAAGQFVKEKEYWINKLSGEIEKGYFPYDDFKISTPGEYPKDITGFNITGELFVRLMEITNGSYPKIYMVLAAGVAALLAKYTGIDDMIVGTSIERQDVQESLINTILPLKILLPGDMTFKELLMEMRKIINEAIENQNYPIETLIKEGEGLFDVVVLLENIQEKKYIEHLQTSMTFFFRADDNEIEGELKYDTSKYEKESIERIIRHLLELLHIALFDVNMNIIDIELLSETEKKELSRFNYTRTQYPHQKTIHELFAEQVEKTPGNISVLDENQESLQQLTYRELNEKSNRLAQCLKQKGIHQGDIVGIMVERSIEMITGIMGILKAGCAYLPIDPNYPQERIDYMLKDSGARALLKSKSETNPNYRSEVIPCAVLNFEDLNLESVSNFEFRASNLNSSNLVYIIYTSGSTGNPKGIAVEHRALVNYVWWAAKMYVKNEKVNFPLYTSMGFDLTVTSLFTPLITGNTIYIYRGESKEFLLDKILADNKVEAVKLTPVHLKLAADQAGKNKFSKIKRFIVGGEKLGTQLAQKIYDNFNNNIEIYNEYGPTEAAVGCMIYKFNPQKDKGASVPIGVPADNVQIYLLDKYMKNVPNGGIGELYIAGHGLARGYLNKPGLTAEKFIANPFKPGEKILKTGDMARRLEGGDIEFLGRADQQVKIKGYRIETAEIEYYLLKHEHIDHAVVLAKNDDTGYNYLVAYILLSRETGQTTLVENKKSSVIELTELRDFLSKYLPEYMIPFYFVPLSAMPLTVNGKIDRKVLPNPAESSMEPQSAYRPPGSEVEQILVKTWQEVMKVDRVGIDDDYFNLGGDSIKAILISSQLRKYNLKLDISDLFQYHTIAQLSSRVGPLKEVAYQGVVEGEVSLTPAQHWFFRQNSRNSRDIHHFNQSVLLYRPQGFKNEIVETVIHKLVHHHDALRMVFKIPPSGGTRAIQIENREVKQFNRGLQPPLVEMQVYEIKEKAFEKIIEEKCDHIQASMDLDRGPLVKLGLFKTGQGDYFLVAIHHLVADTVSLSILFEDFISLYRQLEKGVLEDNLEIPLKTTPYKEWASKLYEYSNSETLMDQIKYWRSLEQSRPFPLFEKKAGPGCQPGKRGQLSFELPEEYTEKLLKQVNNAYKTEINDILLAGLALAVSDWTGMKRVPVMMEGHGREDIIPGIDVSRTVGWFTSIYPVVLEVTGKHDLSFVIKNTKEILRRIPHKGIGYGILKYLTREENKQGIEFCMQPEISFNYLGQADADINNEFFRLKEIPGGNSTASSLEIREKLTIIGVILKGKLMMSMDYDIEACDKTGMEVLVNLYEKHLRQIIDHCTARKEAGLTAGDFSSSIQDQEVELVFDALSEITLDS